MRPVSKFLLILGAGLALVIGAFVLMAPTQETLPGSLIGPPSLSPDGRLIAFTYGKTFENNHLLIYDIDREELRLINKPSRLLVTRPSFSPDGRRLAIATYCDEGCKPEERHYQIAIVDLDTEGMIFVTSGRDFVRTNPIFSSEGNKIYFVAKGLVWREDRLAAGGAWHVDEEFLTSGYFGISRIGLRSKREESGSGDARLDAGFLSMSLTSHTADGRIVFSALRPQDRDLRDEVDLIERPDDGLGYTFHDERLLELLPENALWQMNFLSSSTDGERMVFVSSPVNAPYSYDVYQLVDGEVCRLTKLNTHMAYSVVSGNSEMVVFLADEMRRTNWSIWMHDISSEASKVVLAVQTVISFLKTQQNP